MILHTTDGRHIAFHPVKDRVFAAKKDAVEIEVKGKRFTVRESKREIEKLIRDADI